MARIGVISVDGLRFPNFALMKIVAYHRSIGDVVEWASPLFACSYDKVYQSKVFTFSPDYQTYFPCEVVKGGTGYDLTSQLPDFIENMAPDYSIYPNLDTKTAYGFLTRGCPNKCAWCVVPIKEGYIKPYRDVEEVAVDGRTNLILMDNNILASDYGISQIEKIVRLGYRVDFNQALDARRVTPDIAELLARVKWIKQIRFGCDTMSQIEDCERAMQLIDKHRCRPAQYLLYTMIGNDIYDDYERVSYFRGNLRVRVVVQPFRDYNNPHQIIPQWQKDMARWGNRRELWTTCDFKDFTPRKGFKCNKYF